jgi:hypothetical protein
MVAGRTSHRSLLREYITGSSLQTVAVAPQFSIEILQDNILSHFIPIPFNLPVYPVHAMTYC